MLLIRIQHIVTWACRCSILLSLNLICSIGSSQTKPSPEVPSVDFIKGQDIRNDLDTLKKWVEAMHPSPFTHCAKEDWNAAFMEAKNMYKGGGTRLAAAQVFARLTNVLKDSHTCVSLKSLSEKLRDQHGRLPFEVTAIQNRIYVASENNGVIVKGTEITGIEEQSARMILGMALQLVPIEGDATVARIRLAEKFWNDLGPMIIQSSPSDSLLVQLNGNLINKAEHYVALDASPSDNQKDQNKNPLEWSFNENGTACISLRTFQSNKNNFERSLRKGFRKLKRMNKIKPDNTNGLVIDIRGNAGGNVALMEMILPYLTASPVILPHAVSIRQSAFTKKLNRRTGFSWPLLIHSKNREMRRFSKALRRTPVGTTVEIPFDVPSHPNKRLRFSGKAALLMDGLSASASVAFASWFIQSGRGSTFGEPPMGSASGTFGNPVKRELPHTGLTVNISTAQYFSSAARTWDSKPILPDYPVSWKESDIQNGIDPVLKAAYQWLQDGQQ